MKTSQPDMPSKWYLFSFFLSRNADIELQKNLFCSFNELRYHQPNWMACYFSSVFYISIFTRLNSGDLIYLILQFTQNFFFFIINIWTLWHPRSPPTDDAHFDECKNANSHDDPERSKFNMCYSFQQMKYDKHKLLLKKPNNITNSCARLISILYRMNASTRTNENKKIMSIPIVNSHVCVWAFLNHICFRLNFLLCMSIWGSPAIQTSHFNHFFKVSAIGNLSFQFKYMSVWWTSSKYDN